MNWSGRCVREHWLPHVCTPDPASAVRNELRIKGLSLHFNPVPEERRQVYVMLRLKVEVAEDGMEAMRKAAEARYRAPGQQQQ